MRAWVAAPELTSQRFFDERFGVENIRMLVLEGQIRPARGYHPSLSYLPQAALLALSDRLHRATGREAFDVFGEKGLTPSGYLLCRLLQACFGTLSLYLTFLIGRRLFSPAVGLGGALLLSVVDWHIRQSVIFKPDILLLTACLLAFLWSLDAVERPGWRRYLLAGLGIGIALSSKFNAGPIAIPLFVATLIGGPERDRRRWAWLALAATTAAAVFVLLNPFAALDPELYMRQFGATVRHYGKKGAGRGGSHAYLPLHAVKTLLSDTFHGPLVGTLGLAGVAGAAIAAFRPHQDDPGTRVQWIGRVMALSYVLGYVLLYSLATTYPSPHNWLVLTPFISLFAAWTVARLWRGLAARWHLLARPGMMAAAATPAVAMVVVSGFWAAYLLAVPLTWQAAERHVAESLRPVAGRLVYYEWSGRWLAFKKGRGKAVSVAAAHLDLLSPAKLDRADAELFLEDRLSGTTGDFYRRRVAAVLPHQKFRIHPAPFRFRGPAIVVLLHPWRKAGKPIAFDLALSARKRGQLAGHLPDRIAPEQLGSLDIALSDVLRRSGIASVFLGGKPLAMTRIGGSMEIVATARFDAEEAKRLLVLRLHDPNLAEAAEMRILLHRWQR